MCTRSPSSASCWIKSAIKDKKWPRLICRYVKRLTMCSQACEQDSIFLSSASQRLCGVVTHGCYFNIAFLCSGPWHSCTRCSLIMTFCHSQVRKRHRHISLIGTFVSALPRRQICSKWCLSRFVFYKYFVFFDTKCVRGLTVCLRSNIV